MREELFNKVHGVVYIPTRSYNAYQTWRDYSDAETERDLGYAQSLGFNAIRLWQSFEYWREEPQLFQERFENLLNTASSKGILVMPSLFECCGREPTKANIEDTNQLTAEAIRSPGSTMTNDPARWEEPMAFVDWFMGLYKNDCRLLAIEATNEPKSSNDHRFGVAVAERMRRFSGSLPITIGSQELVDNLLYTDCVDIYQTHENFVLSEAQLKTTLSRIRMVQEVSGKPIWIAEWQRFRNTQFNSFSDDAHFTRQDVLPDHAHLAEVLRDTGVGTFLWSLMLKPAYLTVSRRHGTFSGVFHEDGSVYSLADARAIAGDPTLELPENHTLPTQFERVVALCDQ